MIRHLIARLCRIAPVDQAEQLHQLAEWEQDFREDERRQHVRQQNTAAGAPPRRIGLYTEIRRA